MNGQSHSVREFRGGGGGDLIICDQNVRHVFLVKSGGDCADVIFVL